MVERNIDPCNQSNLSVELIFDILTPRPHFIIIHREEYRKPNANENELKEIFQLVTEFLIQKHQYDNNAIISFHRGAWYQLSHKYFHAHLCVPRKPYCQEAKTMITSKTSQNYWSSSEDYLNQLHEDFLLSKIRYAQYRDNCISMAYLCFNDPVSYCVPLNQFNTSKFMLVYLASSPRIGVIATNMNKDLRALYNFMNNFYLSARKKLSSINCLYENFGVHLCLHVKGKKKNNSQLIERSNQVLVNDINPIKLVGIVGYVQMDEQLYLRWLPLIFQHVWLNEFQRSQHIVQT